MCFLLSIYSKRSLSSKVYILSKPSKTMAKTNHVSKEYTKVLIRLINGELEPLPVLKKKMSSKKVKGNGMALSDDYHKLGLIRNQFQAFIKGD